VQANAAAEPLRKLSDEEVRAQLRTSMVAGHEPTANQLSFVLYEVARHPEVQARLRQEVATMLRAVNDRGDSEYNMADLDGMQYTLAVLKEGLRLHPVVWGPVLSAVRDDVLPLSKPIKTRKGKIISELPVRAGQNVHLSLAGYNRLKDIWGNDAHEFRPERWLDGSVSQKGHQYGVYHNLGNFASGATSCLGWRFAVITIQTFLVEIFRNFHITYPDLGRKLLRSTGGAMAPVLEGDPRKKQLPLDISILE